MFPLDFRLRFFFVLHYLLIIISLLKRGDPVKIGLLYIGERERERETV